MLGLLTSGAFEIEGRLVESSNSALRALLRQEGAHTRAIDQPLAGERPLWDFPDGTLALREVAAYLVSEAGGFGVVPPTVMREGPAGRGSVQQWIDPPTGDWDTEALLTVCAPDEVGEGWLPVLQAQGPRGEPLVVAHADRADLASVAVFDVVVNNADRKGSHLLLDDGGHLWAFDHGVTFHAEPKLRTVLWGWAGSLLPEADRARVELLQASLSPPDGALRRALSALLHETELTALTRRVSGLLASGAFPHPAGDGPALPWPPW